MTSDREQTVAMEHGQASGPDPWLRAYSAAVGFVPDPVCITCTPPEADPDVIVFTEHWKVVLHPDQTMAGACLIGSRRHAPKISALTTDEATDFFSLYAAVELALEQSFGADLVNLSCLRNWAYRDVDPDPPRLDGHPNPHVHWHVAPRYRMSITVAGQTFTDAEFGDELTWTGRRLEHRVRRDIIDRIRRSLPIAFEPPPTPP